MLAFCKPRVPLSYGHHWSSWSMWAGRSLMPYFLVCFWSKTNRCIHTHMPLIWKHLQAFLVEWYSSNPTVTAVCMSFFQKILADSWWMIWNTIPLMANCGLHKSMFQHYRWLENGGFSSWMERLSKPYTHTRMQTVKDAGSWSKWHLSGHWRKSGNDMHLCSLVRWPAHPPKKGKGFRTPYSHLSLGNLLECILRVSSTLPYSFCHLCRDVWVTEDSWKGSVLTDQGGGCKTCAWLRAVPWEWELIYEYCSDTELNKNGWGRTLVMSVRMMVTWTDQQHLSNTGLNDGGWELYLSDVGRNMDWLVNTAAM